MLFFLSKKVAQSNKEYTGNPLYEIVKEADYKNISELGERFNPGTCICHNSSNINHESEKKAYQVNVSFPSDFLGGNNDIFHNLKFHVRDFIFIWEKDAALFFHGLIAEQAKYRGTISFFYYILCFFAGDTRLAERREDNI